MNTAYYVKLKAVNDLGDSVASSAVSFTTEGIPATPTSLSASNETGNSVDIAFTAGAANGASISNYKYAVSTDNITYSAYSSLSPADFTTPITVSGLTSGTLQYVKLKAVNSNGDSVASAAVSFTTLATPSAPTSLSASSGTSAAVISFTPGAQGGSAITNYQYALSTNSGSTYGSFTALATPDATSPITITGLTANTAYYVKLKGVNSSGAGAESSALSFSTTSNVSVNDLVIAGGGGGGPGDQVTYYGGGGGAGGYISSVSGEYTGGGSVTALSPHTIAVNTNCAISVGAGGAGNGGSGSNSSFTGSTLIQSTGGGAAGGSWNRSGASGGSGGGGSGVGYGGGSGTVGQGT